MKFFMYIPGQVVRTCPVFYRRPGDKVATHIRLTEKNMMTETGMTGMCMWEKRKEIDGR